MLKLQVEWGADEALEEAPVPRVRAAPPPVAPRAAAPAVTAIGAATGLATGATGIPAEQAAAAARTLAELRDAVAAFGGCALRDTASNLVFAEGDPAGGLIIIGEAPAADDDRSGRAFDGPAGAFLDRMLASIGLDRGSALLTPLIPWRPPGGRPPTQTEIGACLPFLHRLIVLAAPRRAVLLGPLAARVLLGAAPRRRAKGSAAGWSTVSVPGLPAPLSALCMSSPEALLTKPAGRREAWADLRLLRRTLDDDRANADAKAAW